MSDSILVEYDAFIATITLNKPSKLNALSGDELFRLGSILEEIAKRDDIYATVLTGNGRFFSSGADLGSLGSGEGDLETRQKHWLEHLASHNMRNCKAFYEHPKILIAALNGPVIGYPACLIAFADVVFAVENAYLATPFASLGLVTEGVSSYAFTQRLGMTRANEALIFGKRINAQQLLDCGFLSKVYPQSDAAAFHALVKEQVKKDFASNLDKDSMLEIKSLIRHPYMQTLDALNINEAMVGWRRFVKGTPQQHFKKVAAEAAARKAQNSKL